jgi:ribonuclease HI
MGDNTIVVYTDGSISTFKDLPKGKQQLAGSAVLILKNESGDFDNGTFDNDIIIKNGFMGIHIGTAELLAISIALEKLSLSLHEPEREKATISIYSDSKISVDGLTVYYKTWMKNAENGIWKKSNGLPVDNQKLFEKILELTKRFKRVTFNHVSAHADYERNNEVDIYAKEAVQELYEKVKGSNA